MQTLQVHNPFDHSLVGELPMATSDDVEQALATADRLAKDPDLRLPVPQRIEILENLIELMSADIEGLTQLAAAEGGKPYMDSKVEVERAINGVKLAIEHIPQMAGEQVPMGVNAASMNRLAFTQREPIGVVVSVSAFNHPLNLIVHQTVPAIAVGCPVIIKPAAATPLSCFKFVELLQEAGLPKEWCQALMCSREDSQRLVTDSRVNFFSFIGSAKVGWMLNSKLTPGARAALEHGGVAPVIVDQSANIDEMIPLLAKGGFYHAGQVCVSVQRVYVHESQAQEVAEKLAAAASKMKVGDQLKADTEIGPIISMSELERIESWVKEAQDNGARTLCGGERVGDTCYAATVLLDPPENVKASQHEIFGPVVCVYSYKTRQEAIDRANGLDVAFQAAVFSQNLDAALECSQRLDATAVMINDHTAFRTDWMPFGGRRTSGLGLGGIPYSMHDMTQEKMIVIKSPSI